MVLGEIKIFLQRRVMLVQHTVQLEELFVRRGPNPMGGLITCRPFCTETRTQQRQRRQRRQRLEDSGKATRSRADLGLRTDHKFNPISGPPSAEWTLEGALKPLDENATFSWKQQIGGWQRQNSCLQENEKQTERSRETTKSVELLEFNWRRRSRNWSGPGPGWMS